MKKYDLHRIMRRAWQIKKQNERKSVRTCEAKKETSRKKGRNGETHHWKGMARAGGTLPDASLAGRWSRWSWRGTTCRVVCCVASSWVVYRALDRTLRVSSYANGITWVWFLLSLQNRMLFNVVKVLRVRKKWWWWQFTLSVCVCECYLYQSWRANFHYAQHA